MSVATVNTVPASGMEAGTPAELNEAQLLVWKRLEHARAAITDLTPLDPDWLAMERRHEQHARLNGEDL
jgi:hypothetical protein